MLNAPVNDVILSDESAAADEESKDRYPNQCFHCRGPSTPQRKTGAATLRMTEISVR